MATWNINRNGPNWLMDGDGKLIGYRDSSGGEHKIPQVAGVWGDAEAASGPSTAVTATTDPLTGGISLSAGGVQVGGTASPYAFTSRALTDSDNGQTRVCASAQVATVNTGLPNGFGCAFKGAISFDGTATVTDVRTTGATNPWCGLVNTGTNNYDVVGTKE